MMRTRSSIAAILFALLALPTVADAQAPLLTGLGGTAGFGEDSLAPNDDGSSAFIDLSAAFPAGLRFYGNLYSGLYANNNGNVSFGAALGAFTPTAFPLASTQPAMIAPWWGDIDTRNRTGVGTGNLLYWDISPGRFVATWFDTGYYQQHNERRVSVQLIITDASAFGVAGAFDVELRYNRCEWTTGDASGGTGGFGGTPAGAGFDAADGVNFRELPGSRTMAVQMLCTTSNVGATGVYRFQVRPSGVTICGNGTRELGEACDDGNVVNGDGCNARCDVELPPGSPCGEDIACRSGFCADGVCCDARCGSQCEACNEAGSAGTCVAVTGAPRGGRPGCLAGGTTCGGTCNGTARAACALPGSGVSCDDGSACSVSDVCNGAGSCAGVGLVCDDGLACTVGSCNPAAGTCVHTLVPGHCVIDGACVAAGTVNPTAQCQICDPAASTSAWSPRTGTCDDGNGCTVGDVCAAGACSPGTMTTCPDDGIACTAAACVPATGACETTVTEGCLIGGACVAAGTLDPASTCRECDPSKNTLDWSSLATGTRCSEPSCADGVLTLAGECDGLGTCLEGAMQPCMDGRCADAAMCMGNCASDEECPADRHCEGSICVDDVDDGSPCDRLEMCTSALCVDGICCGTACDGTCESCDVAGSEGTCTPHAEGTDPDDECVDPLACDGASDCQMPMVDAGVDAGGADAGAVDAGGGAFDGGELDAGVPVGSVTGGSCGCAVPGADRRGHAGGLALLALGLALVIARRRAR